MIKNIDSIEKLIAKFVSLGGVGKKTAMRWAYKFVDMSFDDANDFCNSILDVKNKVKFCSICGTFSESEICEICESRKSDILCVVAYPKDVISFEKGGKQNVLYHVLRGTISPLNNRGPDDLTIKQLLGRVENFNEILIATNTDIEGEATALYIAKLIKPLGITVSRLAQGISMGSDIEFVDENTLQRAIDNRLTM